MGAQKLVFESAFATYSSVAQIGSGGSGTVVHAVDASGAEYAVKYLSPQALTSEKIKRFRNELVFCAKNDHPNVVKVLDWGRVDVQGQKVPFYVMPRYPGNLRDLMTKGIAAEKVLPYFSQILDGVEAAHLQSVWHRDLKPENILHTPSSDRLIIADFGIAHFAEAQLHTAVETKPAARLANFQYAAPEQRERGMAVDQRADIYALGLILNQMFTGKLAHGVGFQRVATVSPALSYVDELIDAMLHQAAQHRPDTIATIKRRLIARANDFVAQQRLNELRTKVIPSAQVDDPLIETPPAFVGVKWENGHLYFHLSRTVNSDWIQCFQSPGSHTAILGHGPGTFRFQGDKVVADCDGSIAQQLINHAKQYLQMANQGYRELVENAARQRRAREDAELKRHIQIAEKTQAINKSLQL